MGLFDKLFGRNKVIQESVKAPEITKEKKPRKPKEKKPEVVLTAKEKATQAGEPYVNVVGMEIDPNNIHSGAFELDWNDKFILNLIRAGYKHKDTDTDNEVADRWFQTVCRNIALEMYEQQQADPTNRDLRNVKTKDLGNGRTEVS
jgi:hypothetical protein